jgi:hypothetical protein
MSIGKHVRIDYYGFPGNALDRIAARIDLRGDRFNNHPAAAIPADHPEWRRGNLPGKGFKIDRFDGVLMLWKAVVS